MSLFPFVVYLLCLMCAINDKYNRYPLPNAGRDSSHHLSVFCANTKAHAAIQQDSRWFRIHTINAKLHLIVLITPGFKRQGGQ